MTVDEIIKANIDVVIAIIDKLDDEFDSHDFIPKFAERFEQEYVRLLYKYINSSPFTTLHSQIAQSLGKNQDALGISKVDDGRVHESNNIFNNITPCALWRKVR